MSLADIVQRGCDAVGAGDFDTLVADYVEDMTFIIPPPLCTVRRPMDIGFSGVD
jgi:hypothetical protein